MSQTVYVFDIDSTLADCSERAKLLDKICSVCLGRYSCTLVDKCKEAYCGTCDSTTRPTETQESWDKFNDPSEFLKDTVYKPAAFLLTQLRSKQAPITYITGRHERTREVTEQWLAQHVGRVSTEPLLMRPKDDIRASLIKESIFVNNVLTEYPDANFIFFEDDVHVIPVYSKYGIVVKCPDAWDSGVVLSPMSPPVHMEPVRNI